MDSDPKLLIEIAKKLALLTESLERKGLADTERQAKATEALIQTVQEVRNDVAGLMHQTGQQVTQASRQGVGQALSEDLSSFHQAIQTETTHLESSARSFRAALDQGRDVLSHQIKLNYLAIALSFIVLVAGGSFVLWMQWQSYSDVKAKLASAEISEELIQAYEQVGMTSCGGRPCIKLDSKSPRWGDQKQYVLIDTHPKH